MGPVALLLAELEESATGTSALDAVAVAVAVEDALRITLRDEDITPAALCSPAALRATLAAYLTSDLHPTGGPA